VIVSNEIRAQFRILEAGVKLRGPGEIVEPIVFTYRRFGVEDAGPAAIRVELDAVDATSILVEGRSVELVPSLDVGLQFYQLLLDALMDRLGSHALLHAAALRTRSGGALLLAAPSGHGKTSLTLELTHRGLGFLGDDYAPFDLDRRLILPYPRAVGIHPDGDAPIPSPFRALATESGVTQLFGKSLLDVGQVLGESRIVNEPLPLHGVVLLTARESSGSGSPTRIVVAARSGDGDELQAFFADTTGIEILERAERPHLSLWSLKLEHEASPTEALSRVLDSEKVLFSEKIWDERPDFRGPPAVVPVRRREAAEFLGREMLNRRSGGRLLARHDGNVTSLFLHLAGALREASCWSVSVGGCGETADLIEDLVG